VLEAGTHSPWVSRLLADLGHEVLVANPRRLRLIYENENKSDRVDAEYLARVGRLDPSLLAPSTSLLSRNPGGPGCASQPQLSRARPHPAHHPSSRSGEVLRRSSSELRIEKIEPGLISKGDTGAA
jgi:hypothetical protein